MTQEFMGPVNVYNSIVQSLTLGILRLMEGEIASTRLSLALHQFHHVEKHDISNNPFKETIQCLSKIRYSSYDSFQYMTNFTHLVYATTILDTFLTDTTMFLFLLFPKSIGKNQHISITKLLEASSKSEMLTDAAAKRAREISYMPFNSRVEFLKDTFGLNIQIDEDCQNGLEHYPSVRNMAVHDQGVFELYLQDDGDIASRHKTCPLHPTKIDSEDTIKATKTYTTIAILIAKSIMEDILKAPNHPIIKKLLGLGESFSGDDASKNTIKEPNSAE